jgi:hypothetical protein
VSLPSSYRSQRSHIHLLRVLPLVGCRSKTPTRPSSALLSDAGGPRAGEPLHALDRAPPAAELPRMASGATPEARRRGSLLPTRTTPSQPPSAVATAPTCDRRRPSPPATFLLRPRNRCAHLLVPLQPQCPDGSHQGHGWQKAGGAVGAVGKRVFAASPAVVLQSRASRGAS